MIKNFHHKKNGKTSGELVSSKCYSTSGMKTHIATVHGILNVEVINSVAKNPKITDFTQQIDPLSQDTVSFTLARLISQDLLPINLVVKSSAIKFMLNKTYNIWEISGYLIWKHIEAVYQVIKEELIKIFESSQSLVVTCDDWTNRSMTPFCNVIVRANENDYSLGLIRLFMQDGKSIAQKIIERCNDFHVYPRFITSDRAANMKTMAEAAGYQQQLCIIHSIQLIINDLIFKKLPCSVSPCAIGSDSCSGNENMYLDF